MQTLGTSADSVECCWQARPHPEVAQKTYIQALTLNCKIACARKWLHSHLQSVFTYACTMSRHDHYSCYLTLLLRTNQGLSRAAMVSKI